MKHAWTWGIVVGMMLVAPCVRAQEQDGQAPAESLTQPGRAEPSAAPVAEPSSEQIHQAIRDYIAMIQEDEGAFTLEDEVTGHVRALTLDRVHDEVGQTDELYSACTDMKDAETGESLDLDFDVESWDGELEVVDVTIHRVNGRPRYTYDDAHNRVPVAPITP